MHPLPCREARRPLDACRSGIIRSTSGVTTKDPSVATPALVNAWPHASGPSGVHPKSWLRPGVWTTPTSAAIEPRPDATTSGLRQPVSRV